MSTGGSITIKNPNAVSLTVSITGGGTVTKTGGATSFPETQTGDETYSTTADGTYAVSVKYRGREIAGSPDAALSIELRAGAQCIFTPSPDSGFDFDPGDRTTTTAAISAIANAVNTAGKFAGKTLFNTTTNKLVVATGGAAGDTWKSCDAVTTYTPA